MQLSLRTRRMAALIMGGYPPIQGPYKEMLQVTTATHQMSVNKPLNDASTFETEPTAEDFDWSQVEVTMTESLTKQFVTLYTQLQDFDDKTVQSLIRCPRLCFAGSEDRMDYGETWGNVHVDIVGPLIRHRKELQDAGWDVRILDGLDHTSAMQSANVLPIMRPWLDSKLLSI